MTTIQEQLEIAVSKHIKPAKLEYKGVEGYAQALVNDIDWSINEDETGYIELSIHDTVTGNPIVVKVEP